MMNNLFHENKRSALLLLGLVFLLVIVLYFLLVQPLTKELDLTETQLESTEEEVATLQNEISVGENHVDERDIERLRYADQMPLSPELEEIILMLEEIGSVSNSGIETVDFIYDGTLPENTIEDGESEEIDDTEENLETSKEETSEEITKEGTDSVIDLEEKPENLHVITVNMNVSSPDYEHYRTLIKEIEKQERMMMVSSMEFEKPAESELQFDKNPDESITANIEITTFYYEE